MIKKRCCDIFFTSLNIFNIKILMLDIQIKKTQLIKNVSDVENTSQHPLKKKERSSGLKLGEI